MKVRYLLPCSCGREIPVEASQAGQVVRCQCGAQLETPTLMRMSALKRAPEVVTVVAAPRAPRWGLRQRLALLGAVIAVPFLILAVLMFMTRPRLEDVPTYRPLDSLTFGQTWQIWLDLRQGIDRGPVFAESWYELAVKFNGLWLGVFAALSGVGLLMMVSSLFVPKRTPPPVRKTSSAAGSPP